MKTCITMWALASNGNGVPIGPLVVLLVRGDESPVDDPVLFAFRGHVGVQFAKFEGCDRTNAVLKLLGR